MTSRYGSTLLVFYEKLQGVCFTSNYTETYKVININIII
jgi:hypothetical protein